jgi:hypothetical protein
MTTLETASVNNNVIVNETAIKFYVNNTTDNTRAELWSEDMMNEIINGNLNLLSDVGMTIYHDDSLTFSIVSEEYAFDYTARFTVPQVVQGYYVNGGAWRKISEKVIEQVATKVVKVARRKKGEKVAQVSWK